MRGNIPLNTESKSVFVRFDDQPDALVPLLAQPARLEQRHFRPARRATRRPRPQVCHSRLGDPARVAFVLQIEGIELGVQRVGRHATVVVRLQQLPWPCLVPPLRLGEGALPSLLAHGLELRVRRIGGRQSLPRPSEHSITPRSKMPSKAGRHVRRNVRRIGQQTARPVLILPVPQRRKPFLQTGAALQPPRLQKLLRKVPVSKRKRRKPPPFSCNHPRIVERTPQDEPRHRTEVRRHRLAPQPHRLQRNRPAPCKRIKHPRRTPTERLRDLPPVRLNPPQRLPVRLDPPFPAPPKDAVPGLLSRHATRRVRHLDDHPRHVTKQLVSCLPPCRLRQQRRQQRRPTSRQRTPRRPNVERRDVPVAHVLFVHGVDGDLLDGKGGFNETTVGDVGVRSPVNASGGHFSSFSGRIAVKSLGRL